MLKTAHPSGRMRQWSVVGRELVAMKKSGVRRPKQRPPSDSTMIPDKGLLFATSMARAVYCTHMLTFSLVICRHMQDTKVEPPYVSSRHTVRPKEVAWRACRSVACSSNLLLSWTGLGTLMKIQSL